MTGRLQRGVRRGPGRGESVRDSDEGIELSLFANRIEAVCEEMGAVLRRAAFSPNIRDRLDFSCAVFDRDGLLCAQAAHIPVHLGSMAYAMAEVVAAREWAVGDMVVLNDPYLGGTHLPDVTVVAPVFVDGERLGFVVNRAHHADIGAASPGSMPLSRRLDEEGLVIAPVAVASADGLDEARLAAITGRLRNPDQARGDFAAQISANQVGAKRLAALVRAQGAARYRERLAALNDYGERLARAALAEVPDGRYEFADCLDDDGRGNRDIPIRVTVTAAGGRMTVDFAGTAPQVGGNVNCPLSVTAAAVYYVFRCLMPAQTPACAGSFRPIVVRAPQASLLNARRPAAVAAGNVETSTRVVDVVIGALARALPERMPAASHGSMNNIAMGSRAQPGWDYYETMGGGMGAGREGGGLDGVQTHMTNTLNTPIEVLELNFPLRVRRYSLRTGSGGKGVRRGGEGLVREFVFLAPAEVTLLTERRAHAPWGLAGGDPGTPGENRLDGRLLPSKVALVVEPGQVLSVASAGGGGWGTPPDGG